jgi:hypothetical protein
LQKGKFLQKMIRPIENCRYAIKAKMSDILQVFEVDDIFTRKDAILGLKSSLWAGLGELVNTPLDSSIFGI